MKAILNESKDTSVLQAPYAVRERAGGDLFVVDTANNRLIKYQGGDFSKPIYYPDPSRTNQGAAAEGNVTVAVDGQGTADPKMLAYARTASDLRLLKPMGVGFYQNYVYIADTGHGRVLVLEDLGDRFAVARVFGHFADKGLIRDIAFGPGSSFYLLDGRAGKVTKYSFTGEAQNFSGDVKEISGSFVPYGLTVDEAGNIYVADTSHHQVIQYGPDGSKKLTIGGRGKAEGKLLYPQGVVVDREGSIYIADTENQRIQKFRANGELAGVFGEWGQEKGQFFHARRISLGTRSGVPVVYVPDTTLNRVQVIEVNPFIKIVHEPISVVTAKPLAITAQVTSKLSGEVRAWFNYRIGETGVWQSRILAAQGDGQFSGNLDLADLQTNHVVTYNISAMAMEHGISNTTENFQFKTDLTPPSLEQFKPAQDVFLTGGELEVSGLISDVGFGLTEEGLRLTVGGQQVSHDQITFGQNSFLYKRSLAGLADGSLEVSGRLEDKAGHVTTRIATVYVDTTTPLVNWGEPTLMDFQGPLKRRPGTNRIIAAGRLDLLGTIADANIASYRVEAGAGEYPTAWTKLTEGNLQEGLNNASLTIWDSKKYQDGVVTLRLTARDKAGNESSPVLLTVEVDNTAPRATITKPFFGQVFTVQTLNLTGGNTEVIGLVSDANLKSFSVEAGERHSVADCPTAPAGEFQLLKSESLTDYTDTQSSPRSVAANWSPQGLEPDSTRLFAIRVTAEDAYHREAFCSLFNVGLAGIVITPLPDENMATNNIRYDLSDQGKITVQVYQALQPDKLTSAAAFTNPNFATLVKTIVQNQEQPAGENAVQWDGLNQSGQEVPDSSSNYYYLITAVNDVQFSSFALGRINKQQVPRILALSLNTSTYEICYTINKPLASALLEVRNPQGASIVRFQMGMLGAAGQYCSSWDGKNPYGQPVLSGIYSVYFQGTDEVGNQAEKTVDVALTGSTPQIVAQTPSGRRVVPTWQLDLSSPPPSSQFFTDDIIQGNSWQFNQFRELAQGEKSALEAMVLGNGASVVLALTGQKHIERARRNDDLPRFYQWDGRSREGGNPAGALKVFDLGNQYAQCLIQAGGDAGQCVKVNLVPDTEVKDVSFSEANAGDAIAVSLSLQRSDAEKELLRHYLLNVFDLDGNLVDQVAKLNREDVWSLEEGNLTRTWSPHFEFQNFTWSSAGKSLRTPGLRFDFQAEDLAGNVRHYDPFIIRKAITLSDELEAVIVSDDQLAMLRIPPGAIASGATVGQLQIEVPPPFTEPRTTPPPSGFAFLNQIYNFMPSGVTFKPEKPAILRLYFETDGQGNVLLNGLPVGAKEDELAIVYFDETNHAWQRFGGVVGVENYGTAAERHYIWFKLKHLSVYALVKKEDQSLPVAQITSPVAGSLAASVLSITGTAQDDNLSRYLLQYGKGQNPDSWVTLTEGFQNVSGAALGVWNAELFTGVYSLRLTVADRAGNSQVAFVAVTFPGTGGGAPPPPGEEEVDRQPPQLTGLSLNSLAVSPVSSPVTFTFTLTENALVNLTAVRSTGETLKEIFSDQYLPAGTHAITYAGDTSAGGFGLDGLALFKVTAVDAAGNRAEAASGQFKLDATPPQFSQQTPTQGSAPPQARPPVSVFLTDGQGAGLNPATLAVSYNGQPVTQYTLELGILSFTPPVDVVGGDNTVAVQVQDLVGNQGQSSWTFVGDRTPPTVLSLTTSESPCSPVTSFEVRDACLVAAKVQETGGFTWSLAFLNSGGQTLETFQGTVPPNSSGGPFELDGAWRGHRPFEVEDDGQPLEPGDSNMNIDMVDDGTYSFLLTATDTAGNVATRTGQVVLDNTLPVVGVLNQTTKFLTPKVTPGVMDSVTVTGQVTEALPQKLLWLLQDANGNEIQRQETALSQALNGYQTSYTWNGKLPDQSFAPDGFYALILQVSDAAGNVGQQTATLVVDNTPPVCTPVADVHANENKEVNLKVHGCTDAVSGVASYAWDANGDGSFETSGETLTVQRPDDAEVALAFKVSDHAGNTAASSLRVTFHNVPPVADMGEDREIQYSDPLLFAGTHTETSPVDTHVYEWNFGDATSLVTGPWPQTKDQTHRYLVKPDKYVVRLKVTDDDGGFTTHGAFVTVLKEDSTLAYQGPVRGQYSDPVLMRTQLSEPDANLGDLAGKQVTWTLGTQTASALTDENGVAQAVLVLSQVPGSYTVKTVFEGDVYYHPSQDEDTFVIEKEDAVLINTGDLTEQYSDITDLGARLRDADDQLIPGDENVGIDGRLIHWTLGSQTAQGQTDIQGAVVSTIHLTQIPDAHPLMTVFDGDDYYHPVQISPVFTIAKEDTVLINTGDLTEQYSDITDVAVRLRDLDDVQVPGDGNPGIGEQPILWTLGEQGAQSLTQETGDAHSTIHLIQKPADYPLLTVFQGNDYYLPTQIDPIFTIAKEDTVLVYEGDLSEQYSDVTDVSGMIRDADDMQVPGDGDVGVDGLTLRFNLTHDGSLRDTATAVTAPDGKTATRIPVTQNPVWDNKMITSFGGDDYYLPSSDTDVFTVLKEDTVLVYQGDAFERYNQPATMMAYVRDLDELQVPGDPHVGVKGLDVHWSIGTQTVTGPTSEEGVAKRFLVVRQQPGEYHVVSEFRGTDYYLPSGDEDGFLLVEDLLAARQDKGELQIYRRQEYKPAEAPVFTLATPVIELKDGSTAVQTGDFTGDGLQDVLSVEDDHVLLFTNQGWTGDGQLTFEKQVVGEMKTTTLGKMCAADFNGDKRLDALIAGKKEMLLLINQGEGAAALFTAQLLKASWMKHLNGMDCRDLDRDGHPEVVVGVEEGGLMLLKGDASAIYLQLEIPMRLPQEKWPGKRELHATVLLEDVTGDHVADLLVGAEGTLHLLPGVSGGGFETSYRPAVTVSDEAWFGADLYDVDMDGKLDLHFAAHGGVDQGQAAGRYQGYRWLKGLGDGRFATPKDMDAVSLDSRHWWGVTSPAFVEEGLPPTAVLVTLNTQEQNGLVLPLVEQGVLKVDPWASGGGGAPLREMQVDFGDGAAPAVVAEAALLQGQPIAHQYETNGLFTVRLTVQDEAGQTDIDEKQVRVIRASASRLIATVRPGPVGEGRVKIYPVGAHPDFAAGVSSIVGPGREVASGYYQDMSLGRGVAAGDFDQDGDTDLLVPTTDGETMSVFLLLNTGEDTFHNTLVVDRLSLGKTRDAGVQGAAVSDFDGDGWLDAVFSGGNHTLVALLNDKKGSFGVITSPLHGNMHLGPKGVGDVDGDGNMDVAYADLNRHHHRVLFAEGDGTGRFAGPGSRQLSKGGHVLLKGSRLEPFALAAGDLNGDGRVDVLVDTSEKRNGLRELTFFAAQDEGRFDEGQAAGVQSAARFGVALWDADGDGKKDLLSGDDDGVLKLYPGLGNGRFGAAVALDENQGAIATVAVPQDSSGTGPPPSTAVIKQVSATPLEVPRRGQLTVLWKLGSGVSPSPGGPDTVKLALMDKAQAPLRDLSELIVCGATAPQECEVEVDNRFGVISPGEYFLLLEVTTRPGAPQNQVLIPVSFY